MRRITRYVFPLLVILGLLLAGCGPKATPAPATSQDAEPSEATEEPSAGEGPVTVIFAFPNEEGEVEPRTQMIEMFNESQSDIVVEARPVSPDGYDAANLAAIAAGDPPDVMVSGDVFVGPFIKDGVAKNLSPYFDADPDLSEDDFYASVIDYYRGPNGNVYMMPDVIEAQLLFYNKDLFDAAGLDYPDSSWTWDDFKAAAAALAQGEDLADKVFGFYADDWWAVYLPAVWQNGGRLYSEDGTTCMLDQDEAVEALAWWADFIQQGYSPSPDDLGSLGMGPADLFINGRLGMFQNGTWNVAWFAEEATFEWGVAVLPKGKQQATTLHLTNYVMASNSAHPDAAWEFLKFLASPEVYTLEAMNYSRGVPPRPEVAQAIVANPPAGASPHSVQTIQVVDEMSSYARLPVKIVNWDEFMGDSVEIGLEGLWNGTLTAAEAAAQACSAVNPEPLK